MKQKLLFSVPDCGFCAHNLKAGISCAYGIKEPAIICRVLFVSRFARREAAFPGAGAQAEIDGNSIEGVLWLAGAQAEIDGNSIEGVLWLAGALIEGRFGCAPPKTDADFARLACAIKTAIYQSDNTGEAVAVTLRYLTEKERGHNQRQGLPGADDTKTLNRWARLRNFVTQKLIGSSSKER